MHTEQPEAGPLSPTPNLLLFSSKATTFWTRKAEKQGAWLQIRLGKCWTGPTRPSGTPLAPTQAEKWVAKCPTQGPPTPGQGKHSDSGPGTSQGGQAAQVARGEG